jgi:hypothetical protein
MNKGVRKGQWWRSVTGFEFRVMAVSEGYVLCRRKGCVPFVTKVKDFTLFKQLAIPAKESP